MEAPLARAIASRPHTSAWIGASSRRRLSALVASLSHSRTVLSAPAEASRRPSGLNATAYTAPP